MNRIYHTWDKWECYPAGFYEVNAPNEMGTEEAENVYKELLSDIPEFKRVMRKIIKEWKNSCEHYLTNEKMNRIAWMEQAALTYKYKIPAKYRGGYHKLSETQQRQADEAALEVINEWMRREGYETYTMENIQSKTEANIY